MNRTAILMAATLSFGLGLAPASWAIEAPLVPMEDLGRELEFISSADMKSQKPTELKGEPKAESTSPLYGKISFGADRSMLCRIEKISTPKACQKLILDLNGNQDLSDDAIIESANTTTPQFAMFEPFDRPVGKNEIAEKLQAQFFQYGNTSQVMLMRQGAYMADVTLENGKKLKLKLADSNCDGRLGGRSTGTFSPGKTPAMYTNGGDTLAILDESGEGIADEDFGSFICLDGKPYTLTVSEDQKTLKLEPVTGSMAELTVASSRCIRALVLGRRVEGETWEPIVIQPDEQGKISLQPGDYILDGVRLSAKSGSDVWTIDGQKQNPAMIRLEEGKSIELEAGAPLLVQANAEKSSASGSGVLGVFASALSGNTGNQVTISATITGAAGENMQTLSTNGKPAQPTFKVLDDKGTSVASGQLEYG